MSNILEFPKNKRAGQVKIEKAIDLALSNVKPEYKKRLKKEAINAFKKHENIFTNIKLELPDSITDIQISRIKEAFEKEKEDKLYLVVEIIKLHLSREIDKIEIEKI